MLPFASLMSAPPREPMLAFVARIYYPPNDRRTSHEEIYVSDLRGRSLRQLTHGAKSPQLLQWDGRTRLVWAEERDTELADGTVKFQTTIRELDLRKKRSQVLLRTKQYLNDYDVSLRRGYPFYRLQNSDYGVHSGHLVKVPRNRTGTFANAWLDGDDWAFATGKRLRETLGDTGRIWSDGSVTRPLKFDVSALPYDLFPFIHPVSNSGNIYVLKASTEGELHSTTDYVYSLDWSTGKLTKLAGGLGNLDFDPSSMFYAGTDPGTRDLFSYGGDRTVWGAKLYAGNWRTGKRWLVLGGIVYVTDVAIQPQWPHGLDLRSPERFVPPLRLQSKGNVIHDRSDSSWADRAATGVFRKNLQSLRRSSNKPRPVVRR